MMKLRHDYTRRVQDKEDWARRVNDCAAKVSPLKRGCNMRFIMGRWVEVR